MGDKRKPVYIMMLRNPSKKKINKVEFFRGTDWKRSDRLFRIRVNGKWWPKGEFKLFYKSQLMTRIFRSIEI